MKPFALARALALAMLVLAPAVASAQAYPSRPIKFIVPYPPGGGTDVVARIMNEPLATELGQPIIIENKGGAAGNVGTELAARAPADGYNILFTLSSHTINPKLYDKLPFDVEKDFVPISMATLIPQILVVHPSVPANNVQELIALAKAQPGKLNFASVGTGSPGHIAGELFKLKTGIDIVHVPYKGGGPAVTDTIGGQVQMLFVSMPAVWQHVKSGRVKAIAVTSAKRSVTAPDVPTFVESGVPEVVVDSWYGAFAPAKTPPAIVEYLNKQLVAAINSPSLKTLLESQGAQTVGNTTSDFAKVIGDEIVKWRKVVQVSGAKLD